MKNIKNKCKVTGTYQENNMIYRDFTNVLYIRSIKIV